MTYLRIRLGRHGIITIEIGREEWLLLLVLSGCFAVGTLVTILVRGLDDWLRVGIEAIALYLILLGVYVLSFSTAEWLARLQVRIREIVFKELADKDAEIDRLDREAIAGAAVQAKLEEQKRANKKTIERLDAEIAKLKSESAMQWDIDRLNDVITNQQSHIAELEGRLQRRVSGASLVEYAILLVCVALVIAGVLYTFPDWAGDVFNRMQGALR